MLKFKVDDYVVSKNGKDINGESFPEYGGVGRIVEYDIDDGTYRVKWPDLQGYYNEDDSSDWHRSWQLLPWSVE